MEELTLAQAFREAIDMVDPQANSLMSKDNPPSVKILADWGRKACDELETSPWIKITPETMPEDVQREYWVMTACGTDVAEWYNFTNRGWDWSCTSSGITHYMPSPQLPE